MIARVVYWAAVLAISLMLVFLLIRFLEARDEPQFEQPMALGLVGPAPPPDVGPWASHVGGTRLKDEGGA